MHTPLIVSDRMGRVGFIIHAGKGARDIAVCCNKGDADELVRRANTQPALLEACKLAQSLLARRWDKSDEYARASEACDAAIALTE